MRFFIFAALLFFKHNFKQALVACGYQSLCGVQHDRVTAYQNSSPVFPHAFQDGSSGSFGCGHGNFFEHAGNLFFVAHVHAAHVSHATITRDVGLYSTWMNASRADKAARDIQLFT